MYAKKEAGLYERFGFRLSAGHSFATAFASTAAWCWVPQPPRSTEERPDLVRPDQRAANRREWSGPGRRGAGGRLPASSRPVGP